MRCRSCNVIITNPMSKNLPNGMPEDMCRSCISLSFDTSPDHQYQHGHITDDVLYEIIGTVGEENEESS